MDWQCGGANAELLRLKLNMGRERSRIYDFKATCLLIIQNANCSTNSSVNQKPFLVKFPKLQVHAFLQSMELPLQNVVRTCSTEPKYV
ncbi:hypothetical protein ACJIZ3_016901 [Penstemon smallii]|uniref:Uncharacterized protein n=1 Tax=Penstemon smallii TaxID=265156 RepID=A0ABD3SU37_9LAMI